MNKIQLKNTKVKIARQLFGCWAIGGTYFTGAYDAKSMQGNRKPAFPMV